MSGAGCAQRRTSRSNREGREIILALDSTEELSAAVKLRQNKYLNNRIEQDHRFIKWLVKSGRGFKSFNIAQRTIKGYEIMHIMKKGQIEKVEKGAVKERIKFIAKIFGVAA